MMLKRQYEDNRCTGVQVQHTGIQPEQHFSRRVVLAGITEGWMRREGDQLLLASACGETLVYTIAREPGYYVAGSTERIPVSELAWTELLTQGHSVLTRTEALAYLKAKGLPDQYDLTMAYECVLDEGQHEHWKAVRNKAGNVVAAHTQQEA